jgi:solute carrier family 35, member C2
VYVSSQADLILYIAAWYAISVSLTLFNKWFYTLWMGGFDLPLSATACHMVVKAILAKTLISSHYSPFQEPHLEMGEKEKLFLVIPIGLATAADIVFSNFSFLYITVTLYTILKSASLLWLLFWGVLFMLEK